MTCSYVFVFSLLVSSFLKKLGFEINFIFVFVSVIPLNSYTDVKKTYYTCSVLIEISMTPIQFLNFEKCVRNKFLKFVLQTSIPLQYLFTLGY